MQNYINSNYICLLDCVMQHGKEMGDLYKDGIISRQIVSELKAGRTLRLSTGKAEAVAKYLGCSVSDVLGISTDENENVEKELQNVRDVDRTLFNVTKDMTIREVELLTDFARKLKDANRGY